MPKKKRDADGEYQALIMQSDAARISEIVFFKSCPRMMGAGWGEELPQLDKIQEHQAEFANTLHRTAVHNLEQLEQLIPKIEVWLRDTAPKQIDKLKEIKARYEK